jgi:RNA polymerase sigma factor (sigma-70 family)
LASAEQERELVQRTLAGDRDAFRLIVLAQQGFLSQLVFRQTGDRHATEDLVQETFLRAFRALDRFDPRYRLSTWLARIAINVARDHGRRRSVRDCALDNGPGKLASSNTESSPAEAVVEREAAEAVTNALTRLPEKQREVVVLSMWGGYTQREISRLLELPLGTVKTRQRSALTKLRSLMAPLGPGGLA